MRRGSEGVRAELTNLLFVIQGRYHLKPMKHFNNNKDNHLVISSDCTLTPKYGSNVLPILPNSAV